MRTGTRASAYRSAAGDRGLGPTPQGGSRGGPTTKLHALVGGTGHLVAFITPGRRGDTPVAAELVRLVPASATPAADRGYDSDALRRLRLARGTTPVIPDGPRRENLHSLDRSACKRRNLVERAFGRCNNFRRVATRYDQPAATCSAAISLAAPVAWW